MAYSECSAMACADILACGQACACDDIECRKSCYARQPLGQASYDVLASCAAAGTCSSCAPQP